VVLEARPVFNPQPGGRIRIAVHLDGRVDELSFKLYSVSLRLVAAEGLLGPWGPGWHQVAFDLPELGNGAYYFRVHATGAKGPAGLPKGATVMLLR
jgi:hypothetical protein